MMLPYLEEKVMVGVEYVSLGGVEYSDRQIDAPGFSFLKEFRLDWQTPVWTFEVNGQVLEKRILMPYGNNTVYVSYSLVKGKSLEVVSPIK